MSRLALGYPNRLDRLDCTRLDRTRLALGYPNRLDRLDCTRLDRTRLATTTVRPWFD